jgi:hypothetical protein
MASGTLDAGWTVLPCSTLAGSGSIADPYRLGVITGPLEVQNCPTDANGGWDYFYSFTLTQHPGIGSYAGGSSDTHSGGVDAALATAQDIQLQCPGVNTTTAVICNSDFWWPNAENPDAEAVCVLIQFWGAGSYLLQAAKFVTAPPGEKANAIWINPNYSNATPALAPPGSQLL